MPVRGKVPRRPWPGVGVVVEVEELARQIIDELSHLALLPGVLPLVEVDGVLGGVEELPDGTTILRLLGHVEPTFNVYRLSDPDRLVVDIAKSERGKAVPQVPVDSWAVGRVTISSVEGAAGALLGTKLILNELVAYLQLAGLPEGSLSDSSRLVMTYALCGFANFGSLGILLGGLNTLVPERRKEILSIGPKTLISGTIVTCNTGAIVSLIGLF